MPTNSVLDEQREHLLTMFHFDRGEILESYRNWDLNTPKQKYVFIAIPKTGTVSVNTALSRPWGHWSADWARSVIGTQEWQVAYKFAVVRNPWARQYSFFKYHKQHADNHRPGIDNPAHLMYAAYNKFEDWVAEAMPHHYTLEHQQVIFPPNPHIQFDWISSEGEVIIDEWLKIENIGSEWKRVAIKVANNASEATIAPFRLNISTKRNEYREHYTERSIQIVADICAKDIEYFGYDYGDGI